jgi:hypothetical protein
VYEEEFYDFSYGFRPGRSCHDALRELARHIMHAKVNWIVEADIKGFFDSVDHEWLLKMVAERISDKRVLRLIRRMLTAGVMEEGRRYETEAGTPQGGVITPRTQKVMSAVSKVIRVSRGCRATSVRWRRWRGDAVTDNDRVIADQNLLDDQANDTLTFDYVKRIGGHSQSREEGGERLREVQVRGALPRLISDRLLLGAQGLLALPQLWHPLAQLLKRQELFLIGR